MVARGGWWEVAKTSEGDRKVQTSTYKKISLGDVMYSLVTVVNNTVLYI